MPAPFREPGHSGQVRGGRLDRFQRTRHLVEELLAETFALGLVPVRRRLDVGGGAGVKNDAHSLPGAQAGHDPVADWAPVLEHRAAVIDFPRSTLDLGDPGRGGIRVGRLVEAIDKLTSQKSSLVGRKCQRVREELLRLGGHEQILAPGLVLAGRTQSEAGTRKFQ